MSSWYIVFTINDQERVSQKSNGILNLTLIPHHPNDMFKWRLFRCITKFMQALNYSSVTISYNDHFINLLPQGNSALCIFILSETISVYTLQCAGVGSGNGRTAVSYIYYWSRKVNFLWYYIFIKRVMYHRSWSRQLPYIRNIHSLKLPPPYT